MATCKEKEDHDAMERILHMLLSCCGEDSEMRNDAEGLRLSQLIDQISSELLSRQLENPTIVENCVCDVTGCLLAVMRECLLSHRWVAALRVLTTVVHRLPKRYGRTILHCILELCAQLSLPIPDSLVLRLKTYAELTEHQVAVECFMSRAVADQPLAVCRACLAPLPRRRLVQGRHERRDRLMVRAYDGLASYAQYLDARQTLQQIDDNSEKDLRDETFTRMKAYARDALEKWDGLVDVPGVWDVFVVKQVELLEQAGDLDAAEDVLLKYAGRRRQSLGDGLSVSVWPNALHLLYTFYERHPRPNDDRSRVQVLEELYALVPSHPLTLTLYRELRNDTTRASGRDCVELLFDLLDYAAWRDDIRPWRHLAHDLTTRAPPLGSDTCSPPSTTDSVRHAWSVRKDWWPAYHFSAASLPIKSSMPSEETMSLIGFKASVAYLLMSADNAYTQLALTLADRFVVKTKGVSQLKKVVRKCTTLSLDS